jgi:hypothetical protein
VGLESLLVLVAQGCWSEYLARIRIAMLQIWLGRLLVWDRFDLILHVLLGILRIKAGLSQH